MTTSSNSPNVQIASIEQFLAYLADLSLRVPAQIRQTRMTAMANVDVPPDAFDNTLSALRALSEITRLIDQLRPAAQRLHDLLMNHALSADAGVPPAGSAAAAGAVAPARQQTLTPVPVINSLQMLPVADFANGVLIDPTLASASNQTASLSRRNFSSSAAGRALRAIEQYLALRSNEPVKAGPLRRAAGLTPVAYSKATAKLVEMGLIEKHATRSYGESFYVITGRGQAMLDSTQAAGAAATPLTTPVSRSSPATPPSPRTTRLIPATQALPAAAPAASPGAAVASPALAAPTSPAAAPAVALAAPAAPAQRHTPRQRSAPSRSGKAPLPKLQPKPQPKKARATKPPKARSSPPAPASSPPVRGKRLAGPAKSAKSAKAAPKKSPASARGGKRKRGRTAGSA